MLEAAEKRGQPKPDWARDVPEVKPHEEYYLAAFSHLTTERQMGMSVGPIPNSAVRAYARDTGYHNWEFLSRVISIADGEYMSDLSADSDNSQKSDKVH